MYPSLRTITTRSLVLAGMLLTTLSAHGYEFADSDRWARTATDGTGLSQGDPTTVTWSIAPDTTSIPKSQSQTASSTLIASFDALYPGGSGSDLMQRPWFYLLDESFARWEALSGLTLKYEDDDDGNSFSALNIASRRGVLDERGDIRIGATSIDGQDGTNTIAFAFSPDYGEMVIDTDNTDLFGNTFNQSRAPRNVITHEIGHALGLDHLESSDGQFLMEPSINVAFDGPQLDDILAIHRGYGDHYEKTNAGQGNDTALLATPLGLLMDQVTTSRGTDADDKLVARADTDFVSIDDNSDTDFYSFTIDTAVQLDLTLTPKGPSYNSGPQGGTQTLLDTASLSNLELALIDTDGSSILMQVDETGAGSAEAITDVDLIMPGTYFVRITGSANAPQLYQLDVLANALPPIPGDVDGDRDVDESDLAIVLNQYGAAGQLGDGDLSGDGLIGIEDLDLVLTNWTTGPPVNLIPEPASGVLFVLGWLMFRRRRVAGDAQRPVRSI